MSWCGRDPQALESTKVGKSFRFWNGILFISYSQLTELLTFSLLQDTTDNGAVLNIYRVKDDGAAKMLFYVMRFITFLYICISPLRKGQDKIYL